MIKINRDEIAKRIKDINELPKKIYQIYLNWIVEKFENVNCHSYVDSMINLFYTEIDYNTDVKITRKAAEIIANRENNYIVVFVDKIDGKSIVTIAISKQITNKYKANDIAKDLCKNINAKGGGNTILAQVSTKETFIKWELEILIKEILFKIN